MELDAAVEAGWFENQAEAVRAAELLAHWGTIHVTPQVWLELYRHAPELSAKSVPAWLRRCQLSSVASHQAAQWVQARVLDAGEAEALAYAREIQADIFLTDDTATTQQPKR